MGAEPPTSMTTYRSRLRQLLELQEQTSDLPYSIPHRLKLEKAYRELGYPDLAASDAYKALLLVGEVVEEAEFHEEALEAALNDLKIDTGNPEEENVDHEESAIELARTDWMSTA